MKHIAIIVALLLVTFSLVAQMDASKNEMSTGSGMHMNNHQNGDCMIQMKQKMSGEQNKGKMKGCGNSNCNMMNSGMMKHSLNTEKKGMALNHYNLSNTQKSQYEAERYAMNLNKTYLEADVKKLTMQYNHALKMADFSEAKKLNKVLYQKKAALENLNLELKMKLYNMLDDQQKMLWDHQTKYSKKAISKKR